MVMLKGSNFTDILPQLIKTSIYAVVMNSLAVWSYKKTN
jgi:ABC-2 type transport system permease protein